MLHLSILEAYIIHIFVPYCDMYISTQEFIDEKLLDNQSIINETYFHFLEHRSARSVVMNRMKEASIRSKRVAEIMS